jgi:hypothetical protein
MAWLLAAITHLTVKAAVRVPRWLTTRFLHAV